MGPFKVPAVNNDKLPLGSHTPSSICFTVRLADGLEVKWECVLLGGNLYVEIPKVMPLQGSKESFVSLLEYAETELQVSHIVVCFQKDRADRPSLVKLFMFFGFSLVAPGHELIARLATNDLLFMAYVVE